MPLLNNERRKAARDSLDRFLAHPEAVYAIHYACQSFYDGAQRASTRVAAIAVRQFASGQSTTFSVAKAAELRSIASHQIPLNWDILERDMFDEFYQFVRMNRLARFVHWNMRDDTFGFSALAHRSKVLGVAPEEILPHSTLDLAQALTDLFGERYIKQRDKLAALSTMNGLAMGGFLPGAREADSLRHGRLRQVQMSTQTKVRLIEDIAAKAKDRTLKTEATLLTRYGSPMQAMIEQVWNNPIRSFFAMVVGSSLVIYQVMLKVVG